MRFFSLLSSLLKGKALIVLASIAVVGGATVAAAATPTGQNIVHTITGATATTTQTAKHSNNDAKGLVGAAATADAKNNAKNNCAGSAEVLQQATKFSLSAQSTSADVKVLCSLHNGTFQGITPNGTTVSSSRVFGYGEIEKLLTLAKYLAAHDQANVGAQLVSANLSSYLAVALQKCGTTPLEVCLKTNIPDLDPGNSGNNNGKDNGKGSSNGNGGGKPTSTPTPPIHPTPHH